MRGGPSDSDCKGQGPNRLKLLRHNGWGGERSEKRRGQPRQVRAGKANVSESLKTCRKRRDVIGTELQSLAREKARGIPAYCSSGDRHEGGASPAQALVQNVGTYRFDAKGELQVEDP